MKTIAKNIYLSDDDAEDREFFLLALEEICAECRLIQSSDGDELMEQLHNPLNPKPDIIFLDINMPKKNGLESLEEIRNNAELSDTQVIMFSTSNYPEHVSTAQRLGANLYLVKPSSFILLKKYILDIIQKTG